jgi:PEP-CTERM motif
MPEVQDQVRLRKVLRLGESCVKLPHLNQNIFDRKGGNFTVLRRLLFVVSFALFSATVANADPLILTSGSFTTFRSPSMFINSGAASGPGFSFSGGSTSFECGSTGCDPGTTGFLSTLFRPNAGNGGVLVLDGVTFDAFVVSFGFDEDTVTGIINVFADRNVPIGTEPLFSVDFVGSGFMTVFAFDAPRTFSTTFTVQSVPEPASLFLIGLGVAGLAAKRKFRRSSGRNLGESGH